MSTECAAAATIAPLAISSKPYAQCVHSTLKPVSSFYRIYLYTTNGAFFTVFLYLQFSSSLTHSLSIYLFTSHSMRLPLSLSHHTIFCFVHIFNSLLSFDISFTLGSALPSLLWYTVYIYCYCYCYCYCCCLLLLFLLQLLSETDSFISFAPLELNAYTVVWCLAITI